MEKKDLECCCNSSDHLTTIRIYNIDDDMVYVTTHLTPLPFFYRVWHAILYIFGRRSKYGDFEEYLWTPGTVKELRDFCDDWLKGKK